MTYLPKRSVFFILCLMHLCNARNERQAFEGTPVVIEGTTFTDDNEQVDEANKLQIALSDAMNIFVGKDASRCQLCGSGCYCSEKCQVKHQPEHQEVCKWIQQLEKIENSKRVLTVQEVFQVNYKTINKL